MIAPNVSAEILVGSIYCDTVAFLRARGWKPYPWQEYVYGLGRVPIMIVSTRQAGKTWMMAGKAYHIGNEYRGSVSAIVCPDQDKSKRVVERVEDIHLRDSGAKAFEPDNTEEKGLWNGSVIRALPGTVKGVVSYTVKLLGFDEGNLIPRNLYEAATPTQAAVSDPWIYAMSSAWYKVGWFWDDWHNGTGGWTRILVRAKYDIRDGRIVDYLPESEFKAMWAEQGITAFYSDTPTREFLELELTRHPESQIRQQYFCEFQDIQGAVFSDQWIERAFANDIQPLFEDRSGLDDSIEPLEDAG